MIEMTDIEEYLHLIDPISTGEIMTTEVDEYSVADFKLNIRGVREVKSCISVDSDGFHQAEFRLPPMEGDISQEDAQDKLDDIISDCGFPDGTYTYVRPHSKNPHVKIDNTDVSVEDLVESVSELMNRIKRYRETEQYGSSRY